MSRIRPVVRVVHGRAASDGAGVRLNRVIGSPSLPDLDPFLLLDEIHSDGVERLRRRASRIIRTAASRRSRTCSPAAMRHGDDQGNRGLLRAGQRAVDDRRPRHRALRDAGAGGRAHVGLPALGEPARDGQDDRAALPGHRPRGDARARRSTARACASSPAASATPKVRSAASRPSPCSSTWRCPRAAASSTPCRRATPRSCTCARARRRSARATRAARAREGARRPRRRRSRRGVGARRRRAGARRRRPAPPRTGRALRPVRDEHGGGDPPGDRRLQRRALHAVAGARARERRRSQSRNAAVPSSVRQPPLAYMME